MKYDTAGDPMTGLKWTKRTTAKIAQELQAAGINVSRTTVARLLREMGFSLRVNHKKISSASDKDRNEQFEHIATLREQFAKDCLPVISVDTKKKEMIGQFKNPGAAWNKNPIPVKDHDFRSEAIGMAIPYGVYDIHDNSAAVSIGWSSDTSQFAVASIARWWQYQGHHRYPHANEILILADNGGSNSARCHTWRYFLQQRIANQLGLKITVAHYPPGTSKWNPIEHRLFSQITKNWEGRPLDSYQTCLNYISTTTTTTGLRVKAYLDTALYQTGLKINKCQIRRLNLEYASTLPKWNYSLSPN